MQLDYVEHTKTLVISPTSSRDEALLQSLLDSGQPINVTVLTSDLNGHGEWEETNRLLTAS